MKLLKYLLLTSLFFNLLSCKKSEAIKDVNTTEFKEIIKNEKTIILDVRTPEEVEQGHIINSSAINFYDDSFVEKINLINKSGAIAVYCKSGGRSSRAAKILSENGFTKIYNLNGGMMAWEKAKLPISNVTFKKDENIKKMELVEFQELLKTDKPLLVNFHTVWCSPCRKMAPIVDAIEKEFENNAIVMRIDTDKSKEIARHYKIESVPVFILYKNGTMQWKHNGIISKEALKEQLKKAQAIN